ncbi:MAG: amidohydrolase family protein [Acidobacteriota bacterium]|nr:amidohydrolase family protein [Acidobacteriota bacterium]
MSGAGRFSKRHLVAIAVRGLVVAGFGTLPGSAERPRVYAITGATVVTAPGHVIENGTVMLRDGLIEAVGAGVAVPSDAEEIDGAGLHVYPGLIDPLTGLGQAGQSQQAGQGGGAPPSSGGTRREMPRGPVHLPYHAAMAVAFGLPRDEALRALTIGPARILGLDHALGSIEPGKSASLIVTDGDPLEIRTRVERQYIDGREVDVRDNKHERLYERYASRPGGPAAGK